MKLPPTLLALLGGPAALAAVASPYPTSTPNPTTHLLTQRGIQTPPPVPSSISITPSGSQTAIAVFTANGIPYTITSLLGVEEGDGFTLTPGAPALIGGLDVVEPTSGRGVIVNGATVGFTVVVSSSVIGGGAGSSMAAPASSGGSGSGGASSSSQGGAVETGKAKLGMVLGAVAGVLIL